jgi:hypothetical protein
VIVLKLAVGMFAIWQFLQMLNFLLDGKAPR